MSQRPIMPSTQLHGINFGSNWQASTKNVILKRAMKIILPAEFQVSKAREPAAQGLSCCKKAGQIHLSRSTAHNFVHR